MSLPPSLNVSPAYDAAEALSELLDDPVCRHQFFDLMSFTYLLDRCIVNSTYRISDEWVRPLKFTPLGEQVISDVMSRRPRLKPNDVKLATALEFGTANGVLVDPASEVEALRKQLSRELGRGNILLPYIFGRDLHDLAAEQYPEKTSFNNRDTIALLKQLPIGVFQAGWSTTGPFGCLASIEYRQMLPRFAAPGYYCSDPTCTDIHDIRLRTGDSAVSKARMQVQTYLSELESDDRTLGRRLVKEAMYQELDLHTTKNPESLIEAIADGLDGNELRSVANVLLRREFRNPETRPRLQKSLGCVIGSPTEFVRSLTRPKIIQLVLLFSDRSLEQAIDEAVFGRKVSIQPYELRSSQISRFGRSMVRAEIGSAGLRYTSTPDSGFVSERLLELLHYLYFEGSATRPADLRYLLGSSAPDRDDALLDWAVRELPPEQALNDLVLGHRSAAVRACEFFGIDHPDGLLNRDVLFDQLSWKLGLPKAMLFTDLQEIEKFESSLAAGLRNEGAPREVLRGQISNLFAAIEDALSRALVFSTWALTFDHFLAEDGFTYDPSLGGTVYSFMDDHAPVDTPEHGLAANGRNSLAPLASGFARLSKALKNLRPSLYERPTPQIPLEVRYSGRPFAFPYTIPFLNLTDEARDAVTSALGSVASDLQDRNVSNVRNATIHGNNDFPARDEIFVALGRIKNWRASMLREGIYPRVFSLSSTHYDDLGRARYVYVSYPDEVVLHAPSWAVAPGLPVGLSSQVIMTAAQVVSAGPLRFKVNPRPGGDPYWAGWPRRWNINHGFKGEKTTMPAPADVESA